MANKSFLGMRGKSLNWAISTIAGCDFLLFGYGIAASIPYRRAQIPLHPLTYSLQIKVSWVASSPYPSSSNNSP